MGVGMGVGMGWEQCEQEAKKSYSLVTEWAN